MDEKHRSKTNVTFKEFRLEGHLDTMVLNLFVQETILSCHQFGGW